MSCIKVPVTLTDVSTRTVESNNDLPGIINKNNKLLKAAKRVFGNGWSHSITNSTIDFIDQNGTNYSVGCYTTVKVQLANGMYHEDCGYSNIESSSKGLSIEKARMTSVMNALSKALSCFSEMDEEMKQFNNTLNVSAISKTKFPLKRPISPSPPPAQSTPKVTKSATALFDNTQLKKSTNSTSVSDNGKIETVNINDLDSIFQSPIEINVHSIVPSSSSASTSVTLTEEEMRLERKRKQREKQEEFKRLMKNKEMEKRTLDVQKPNSKF